MFYISLIPYQTQLQVNAAITVQLFALSLKKGILILGTMWWSVGHAYESSCQQPRSTALSSKGVEGAFQSFMISRAEIVDQWWNIITILYCLIWDYKQVKFLINLQKQTYKSNMQASYKRGKQDLYMPVLLFSSKEESFLLATFEVNDAHSKWVTFRMNCSTVNSQDE